MRGWKLSLVGILLAAAALAGPAPSGEYLFPVLKDRRVAEFVRVGPDGAEIKRLPASGRRFGGIRATSKGTVVVWDDKAVVEMDREGKTLAEFPVPAGVRVDSAELLAGGSFWILTSGKGSGVLEVDREGKTVRKLALSSYVLAARPLPDGGVVGVSLQAILEFDREGKERLRVPIEDGVYGHDVAKLEGGRYILSADVTAIESKRLGKATKAGRVTELDREGKAVWTAAPVCPTTIQALPTGNILIGGG